MQTELQSAIDAPSAATWHLTKGTQSKLGVGTLVPAVFVLAVLALPTLHAQTLTTLYTFCSTLGCTDGYQPQAGLVGGRKGNLYGTTYAGGVYQSGTIFRVTRTGKETLLYHFRGAPDAGFPLYGSLILDAKGNLYGVSAYGGSPQCAETLQVGCGTVFKFEPSGKETVLYGFKGGADGETPFSRLLLDANGNLYGTTVFGGTGVCPTFSGCGTVFKIDTKGRETILHTFDSSTGDGAFPEAGLVMDANGNLYGTTAEGGASGFGTVFKLDQSSKETLLYSFQGGADGKYPGGLLMGADGSLYGTTGNGGTYSLGTVFKLDTNGQESVLFDFDLTHGATPSPGMTLIADVAGNLYGTTQAGGAGPERGTVFKLDRSGNESVLHSFCAIGKCLDGQDPVGSLVMDGKGNLFGVTANGGSGVNPVMGTVFKLTP